LLGTEKVSSDHLDFLYRPGYERAVVRESLNYLELFQKTWDKIQFSDFADDSVIIGMLQADAVAHGFALLSNRTINICPYLRLPDSTVSFYDSLSANLRRNVRKRIRQLQKLGFGLQVVAETKKYLQIFQEMVRLHKMRWQADSLPGNFSDPRVLDFHRMLLSLETSSWQPRFFLLTNEDKIIAALYTFVYRDKLLGYQAGYDPAYNKYSPGSVLMTSVIEYAIGQHLIKEFDLLQGDEAYKWQWTNEYRRTMSYSLFQKKVKCGIQLVFDHGLQEVKRQFKRPVISRSRLQRPGEQFFDTNGDQVGNGRVGYKSNQLTHAI
jgi:CelD/BcsL family acetyltransferase involved in cellulose biosynthesis